MSADWMANMSAELKQKPIYDIMMPASHDSTAAEILNVKVSNSGFTYWAHKFSWLPFVKKFISKWTLTQNLSTREQLELGIRAFDWRVSVELDANAENKAPTSAHVSLPKFYFSHSFAVANALSVIAEVGEFLEAHPGEVVYILAKPDTRNNSNWNQTLSNQFASQVIARLGDLMVPTNTENLTVQSLVEHNDRIFFYWSGRIDDNDLVWRQPWGMIQDDYTTVESKLERADDFLRTIEKSSARVNILALTLTPTDATIKEALSRELLHPCSPQTSLQTWTESMHEVMYDWLESKSRDELDKLRILTTDFVDEKFVEWVITFNETTN